MPVHKSPRGDSPPLGETPSSGRNPNGTFSAGNRAALKHGGRSAQVAAARLTEQSSVRQALADKRAAILVDVGAENGLSQLQRDLIDRYVELDTIATWLGGRLVAEGALTTTGRTRTALTAYLHVLDRVHRVGTALGLERRQKKAANALELLRTGHVSSTDDH